MQYAYYLLAPFAILGSAEFRGFWVVAVLRAILRLAFVFGLAFYLTWLLVKQDSFAPPKPAEVARQVCLVISAEHTSCSLAPEGEAPIYVESWLAALETQGLHHADVVKELTEIDKTIEVTKASYQVQVRGDDGWEDLPNGATMKDGAADYRLVARLQSNRGPREVILLTVELAMVELPAPSGLWSQTALFDLWTKKFGLDWPFRAIQFQASPYVLSSLVLREADPDMSTRDAGRAKDIMDSYLDAVPAAASAGFVWPRRLNGPVQYACYMLFFVGLIYILLHWTVNILPNQLLRATSVFTVRSDRFLDPDGRASVNTEAVPEEAQVGARDAEEAREASEEIEADHKGPPDTPPPLSRRTAHADGPTGEMPAKVDIEAPWTRTTTDLDKTIREMEAIRDVVRYRAGFFAVGAVPAFPKLDVWIAGLLAMKSSRTGENVPSFISTEIEAAAERMEAHQRLLAFIVWAIPTLGFIGTVIGIGTALLATVDLQSGDIITRLQAESRVAVEIGVAFDTTLIALALSFVLMLALHLLQHLEESMLSEEKLDALRALVQIENILPDDPIRELRDGLAQLGLTGAQIERWSDILAGQAPKFREVMDNADREISEWSRQSKKRGRSGGFNVLSIGGLLILVIVLGLYTIDPALFWLIK